MVAAAAVGAGGGETGAALDVGPVEIRWRRVRARRGSEN